MSNEILCGGCGKVHPLWIAVDAKPVNCSECGKQVEQRHVEQPEVQPQFSGGGDKVNSMWIVGGFSAIALLLLVLCGVGGGAYFLVMTPRAEEPDNENIIAKTQSNVIEENDNSPDAAPPVSSHDKPTATDGIAAGEKAAAEKAAGEKAAGEKAAAEKAAAEKAAAEKAAAEKAAADKAAADKAAADKAAADKAAADKAAADKAAADKAAADKAAADKPAADKPAAEKPAADKPAAEKPAPEKPDVVLKGYPIGDALSGRAKEKKQELIAAYGGTEATESAVISALEWLKRYQLPDGTWSLSGSYSGGIDIQNENLVAATAMALLAFQGHGSTHKFGPYQAVVARGWNMLIKQQDATGKFVSVCPDHHSEYTHAIATMALCELYGMTKDETFKVPAEKALSYCFSSQSPQGGWRYNPKGLSDTSVTGWFLLALQSGRMAGLTVPHANLARISAYLDTVTREGGIKYAYTPRVGPSLAMTAEGLLCRQYLGWKKTDARVLKGLDYLLQNPIRFTEMEMDVYYWYYATQTMHHMGGKHWKQWNSVMRQSIPKKQIKIGNERGSWEPSPRSRAGRLYTTCFCVYMLEVYYRHLPIYQDGLN